MYNLRFLKRLQSLVSTATVSTVLLQAIGVSFFQAVLWYPLPVAAAETVIDSTVSSAAEANNIAGAQTVFVDSDTGYSFYKDSNSQCVYSKTTDAGATWGSAVTVDSQTDCLKIVVWYDQWTPADNSGTNIHIATMDNSDDGLFYNRLDTSSDTLFLGSTPVNATTNSGQTPTFVAAQNAHTITKASDGKIYLTASDDADAYTVSCATGCGTATNWTEVGAATNPLTLANDFNILLPLLGGDILLINRDISANDIRSAVWDGSTWSSWTVVDANATEDATYDVAMAAAVNKTSGDVYLAYGADLADAVANDDIRTAVYSSGGWSAGGDVVTNASGSVRQVALGIDQNTSDVYVTYTISDTFATPATGNIYWKKSSNNLTTWGAKQGPLNTTAGDFYGIATNLNSNQRLYATWFDVAATARKGETVAELVPDALLSTVANQIAQVLAGEAAVHIGGAWSISSDSAQTVSEITISEMGSIAADTGLANIALYYDLDTTAPYDCAAETFSGSETQFGATKSDGFSGANGSATFAGSAVGISPTKTMCVYTVLDITPSAGDGSVIDIEISNPTTDIIISGGTVSPATPVKLAGQTTVVSADLTQSHYHWRNDDGSETAASSATAGDEDTPLSDLAHSIPQRLRLQISNEGSTSTVVAPQLEYALAAPTCQAASTWTDVAAADDAWNMADSPNLTDGADTTNINLASGGVSDENSTFLTPNASIKDTSSLVSSLSMATTDFLELEYSVVASTTATAGETYCFRLSDAGTELASYSVYPQVTMAADVLVGAVGSQIALADIPTANNYFGGAFSVLSNDAAQTVTAVTLSETGSVAADSALKNVKLFYKNDTTAPYNCTSETYTGSELQFGATKTAGFSAPDGTVTFNDSQNISATSALCLFVVADVTSAATAGETVVFTIATPTTDVSVTGASVAPGTPVTVNGVTTLQGGALTQSHYHWRNDDGSEADASSATGNSQDTVLTDFARSTPIRLRLQVANTGATSTTNNRFQLEYSPRVTTCAEAGVWTAVAASDDDWNMADSTFLTDGANTTNIAEATGGTADENTTFLTPNGALRDTTDMTAALSLTNTEFVELEYSIQSTQTTAYNTNYCFRVTDAGEPLQAYTNYAQLQTSARADYQVQRGRSVISGTSTTITAGADYAAPTGVDTAFVRITNSHHTGAGNSTGGGEQAASAVTAYISNPENISSSLTFERADTTADTAIDWEILEFIGQPGTDNQTIVRDVGVLSLASGDNSASGAAVTVTDGADVVVFITGVKNLAADKSYHAGQVTSDWDAGSNSPLFLRGANSSAIEVSYAVVEYVGENWSVQRVEHNYATSSEAETENITAVNALDKTFLHTQKRLGTEQSVRDFGQTVWLSSIGAVSFKLENDASLAGQTAVAWVIENTQTGSGAMNVQRTNGSTNNGAEPLALSLPIMAPLQRVNNASIFMNTSAALADTTHPRALAGARITSTSTYEIWRSDTGAELSYRTEIVQWPVADLSMRQNYYRFYQDNQTLTPSDPWPPGPTDLGENTGITSADQPLGAGDFLRLRTTVRVTNANLPANFQQFKLQFAPRVSTCTAVGQWYDVGGAASSTAWRGYSSTSTTDGVALSSDPALPGDLLISVADIAGRLAQQNPMTKNPYAVVDGEDLELDWYLQQNDAEPDTTYCFRMTEADGTALNGYFNYPQIKTAAFQPRTANWRWYSDPDNETPNTALVAENTAPANIQTGDLLALRMTVQERSGVAGVDSKFKLQFSEDSDFANPIDVVSTSTCQEDSLWCFYDGGGAENSHISTALLSDSASCLAGVGSGCGTHNQSAVYQAGHLHEAGQAQEYSFTIKPANPRVNAVYYFRLINLLTSEPVGLASGAEYPSVLSGASKLSFLVSGLPAGTTTAGVITDATTTATAVNFGAISFNDDFVAAQRITIETNATEGYQIFKYASQDLLNSYGVAIEPINADDAAPGSWSTACLASSTGCAGYHTTDGVLANGSTRFAATDSYAGLSTVPVEIMFNSLPIADTVDVIYRIQVTEAQPAGDYVTDITYLAVPVF